ncbi:MULTISPECIES: hypothetical protein [Lactiplantibacillus]|uniref:hypothetical protein n=1 Tax=Lactiplantibacillus TaxID=2767842 RepID=UPI001C1F5C69|nr:MULTISPECIES: hypothetical protein [Lactiplantibacillus]MBU7448599.1 hypothetical protein [Lactiplantibacillus sp. 7.2.4]MBU7480267.1 hypothetical protein [Lactiplantibacillus pentosus]
MRFKSLFILPLALLLVGCSTNQSTTKSDASSSSARKTTTVSKKASVKQSKKAATKSKSKAAATSTRQTSKQTTSSSKQSSTAKASSSASTQSSTKATTTTNGTTRLATLNQQLTKALGNVLLPQTDGLTSGSQQLNVRYQGSQANYTVSYSVGQTAQAFNSQAVAKETPYATVNKKTYASNQAAAQAIGHRNASDAKGLPTVDLGHQITGYLDSGAGQRYILWNEGQWSLQVHTYTTQNDLGVALAKQTVNTLESYYLPAPKSVGSIELEAISTDGLRQVIQWQAGRVVYKVSAHDATTAIKLAASMQ